MQIADNWAGQRAARSTVFRLVVAVFLVALAAAMLVTVLPGMGMRAAILVLYPAIAVAAIFGGFWPGLLATALGGALADWFLMAPVRSFHLIDRSDSLALAIFGISGLLISGVAERAARHSRDLALAGDRLRAEIERRSLYEDGFRNIIEIAPQGMLVVDRHGLIELINADAERAFGYDHRALIGTSIDLLVPERLRGAHAGLRQSYFHTPDARRMGDGRELFGLRRDGTEFPVEIGIAPMPDRDGMKIVATITDISARKAVEQALHESELQKDLMFGSIQDHAIFMIGTDGRVMTWNDGAERLKGYSADEIIGLDIAIFYPPEDVAAGRPRNNLISAEHAGRTEDTGWHIRKDGSRFLANCVINSVRTASGELRGFVKVTRDVTERKRIEDELARSHERVSIAADAAGLGFWDFDMTSQTMHWDDWMYQLYGRAPMPGRQSLKFWADALHHDERADAQLMLDEAMAGRAAFDTDLRIRTPSGEERFLRSSSHVVRNPDGTPREVVGVNIDITAMKRAQIRLSEERDKAESANRAKSGFVAMMSHEVRTPMNAVIGMNALLCETELDSRQLELAQGVSQSAEMLLQIIDDILDVSKLDAGRLQIESIPFHLPRFLDQSIALMAAQAEAKGLWLTSNLSGAGVEDIVGDPTRLRQIILNLVSNAIKFTAQGSVSVNAHGERHGSDLLRIRIEVSDTGMGIDAEGKTRLFRPFEQMDNTIARRFGGSGLGLNICKHLVTLMGGTIGVKDRPGGGTIFWIELDLPISLAESIPVLPVPQKPVIASRETGRILLAEDNAFNVKLAQLTLQPVGYAIDVALNGLQAVEFAGQHRYDLILMDVQMPELDGLGATRLIRKSESVSGRHVPIIAMTANASAEDHAICREAGMDDFLAKPCDPKRLREVVKHWIGLAATDEALIALPAIADLKNL